eukprot:scaffold328_cov95-Skeletonema_dohrnii-CCMP3373.AAC.10
MREAVLCCDNQDMKRQHRCMWNAFSGQSFVGGNSIKAKSKSFELKQKRHASKRRKWDLSVDPVDSHFSYF